MEDYRLEQSGQEVQNILNGAAMQTDLTAEVERATEAEGVLQQGISDEAYAREQADLTLDGKIDGEEIRAKAAEKQNADDIDAIEEKIPAAASSSNKLADVDFVNSSISTATATFRGAYNLVSDLHLAVDATHEQIATLLGTVINEADKNDYAYVQIPTSAETPTQIASVEKYTFTPDGWAFAYALNNSGFTAAQWAAINSGITSGLVAKLNELPSNTELLALLGAKQDTLTFDNVPTENSNNPVKSGGVYSAIKDEETRAKAAEKQNADDIDAIEEKIPAEASSSNKLADQDFVNSSIETATATFRGSYNLVSDLHLAVDATHEQIATMLAGTIATADKNDYAYVQIPTSAETPTEIARVEKYTYNGTAWAFAYALNNSGFTSAQWAAINSTITSGLVAKLSALPTNTELANLLAAKQDVLTFDNVPTENSNNPVKSGGVYAADKALSDAIEAILLLIPSAATSLNKLVDQALMNSSISTATATFRGTYNLVNDLSLDVDATEQQIATALASTISTADNNDYAFVQIPTSGSTPTEIARTDRYKYNGTVWAFEYTLNTSGFTSAQWAAINSAITSALVAKLSALPTNDELTQALGLLSTGISGINQKIPSSAASDNKLVDQSGMNEFVALALSAIDATFNVQSTDGHITLHITQVDGEITSVQVQSSDIASAADLTALAGRVTTAEGNISTNSANIANLQQLYNNLQQSKPVPVTALPTSGQQQGVIYRLAGTTSYSDYMWNGSDWVLMATYNNGIDDEPLYGSNNISKSGGNFDADSKATVNSLIRIASYFNTDSSHVSITNGVLTFEQIANTHQSFNTGVIAKGSKIRILLTASCVSGTQKIMVGTFSSSQQPYCKEVTLTAEPQSYLIDLDYTGSDANAIEFGILKANVNVGNTVTITSAYMYHTEFGKYIETPVDDIIKIASKYIDTNGTISDANNNYAVLKFRIRKDGGVRIKSLRSGSGLSFCKYTDATYNTLEKVIVGEVTVAYENIYELTAGYYCLSEYLAGGASISTVEVFYSNIIDSVTDSVKPVTSQAVMKRSNDTLNGNILELGGVFQTTAEQTDEGIVMHQTSAVNSAFYTQFAPNVGKSYSLRIKGYCATGTQRVFVGDFSSPASDDAYKKSIVLTTTEQIFELSLFAPADFARRINFGIFAADINVGNDVTITFLEYTAHDAVATILENGVTFNTEAFLQSVSRKDKYLVKIACEGDSLIANAVGGAIPYGLDEGEKMRPMRMITNNIPRRLYDYMSWNKPVWRRCDHSDWTLSGFSVASWSGVFEGTQEVYHTATQQGAYAEITIPQGYEHFALIARTKAGNGSLNVSINNGLPSAITYINQVLLDNPEKTKAELEALIQGNTVCNESVCPINVPCGDNAIDLDKGISAWGNPYAIFEYNNLPSGQANVIRFTADSATEVDIWGGFYWSGNTMVIMNIAHGGHDTSMLVQQHLPDELYTAGYDAVLFEVPEMNNMRLSLAQTESDLVDIVQTLENLGIDKCFTSCNMLGMSIIYDVNFYVSDLEGNPHDKTQLQINDLVRKVMAENGQAFVDLFQYFRWHVENNGGTLEGGQGGLLYSWDGQHPNIEGCTIWVEGLKKVIDNTPIMLE